MSTSTDPVPEVEAAIADGRIPVSERRRWERLFEMDATMAHTVLETTRRPDWAVARANRQAHLDGLPIADLHRLHEREFAARLGVKPEELI